MYTFPNKLRNLSITLMIVGFLGLTYGFLNAPSNLEESKSMVSANHGDGHSESGSGDHGIISDHQIDSQHDTEEIVHGSESSHRDSKTNQDVSHDLDHDEHVFHQLSNKPWAAFYVAAFFFFMISLGVLAFYAIQRAAQAGWSPVLYRVMEGITAYLLPGGIIIIIFGIHFTQIIQIPFLNNDTRIHLQNYRPGLIGSYIIGLSFAFGWTPCIGPILGSVLSIAASSETVSTGIILLMIYSAGLGIPFLLAAYGIGGFLKFLSKIRKYIRAIEIFTGLLLILFGFLILTNRIQEIAFFFIKYFPILSQIG